MRVALLAAILLCALPAAAAAQEVPTPPEIPPGADRIETMIAGRPAPFNGMLLDTDTAIRWTNRLLWWRETYRLQLRSDAEIRTALSRSRETELTIVQESYTREIDALRATVRELTARYERQLQSYRSPPFYAQWGFAFGLGATVVAVVGALVAGLAAGL